MSDSKQLQLDSLETTASVRPPETYRAYCRQHCQAELDATAELYQVFDPANSANRIKAFESCRTEAFFARNELTGKVRVLSHSCHLRWCPMCASTRRWFLTQQVSDWLADASKPKFLTLTLAHTSAPLASQLNHLYNCFRKYRQLNLLKRNITGGVWFFQIKKSDNDNNWHPHLHCVIDSEFIDKYELSAAWAAITLTSRIIDIKAVTNVDKMAEYVARYAARPSILSALEPADRLELVDALHGRRLVGTWGSARSISLRPSKPPDAEQWKNIGSWALVRELLSSDPRAIEIWKAYQTDSELPEDCNLLDVENFLNNVHTFNPHTVEDRYEQLKLFDTKWYNI